MVAHAEGGEAQFFQQAVGSGVVGVGFSKGAGGVEGLEGEAYQGACDFAGVALMLVLGQHEPGKFAAGFPFDGVLGDAGGADGGQGVFMHEDACPAVFDAPVGVPFSEHFGGLRCGPRAAEVAHHVRVAEDALQGRLVAGRRAAQEEALGFEEDGGGHGYSSIGAIGWVRKLRFFISVTK